MGPRAAGCWRAVCCWRRVSAGWLAAGWRRTGRRAQRRAGVAARGRTFRGRSTNCPERTVSATSPKCPTLNARRPRGRCQAPGTPAAAYPTPAARPPFAIFLTCGNVDIPYSVRFFRAGVFPILFPARTQQEKRNSRRGEHVSENESAPAPKRASRGHRGRRGRNRGVRLARAAQLLQRHLPHADGWLSGNLRGDARPTRYRQVGQPRGRRVRHAFRRASHQQQAKPTALPATSPS